MIFLLSLNFSSTLCIFLNVDHNYVDLLNMVFLVISMVYVNPANTKHVYNIFTTCIQHRANVFDAGPALYKYHTIVLRLQGYEYSLTESCIYTLVP